MAEQEEDLVAKGRARVARVKLPPPDGCRLHDSDEGVDTSSLIPRSVITQVAIAALEEIKGSSPQRDQNQQRSSSSACSDKTKDDATACAETDTVNTIVDESTAAALWQILASTASTEDGLTSHPIIDPHPPYELDSCDTELPYVHANSLIGYSNGPVATVSSPGYQWRPLLADSGVHLPIFHLAEEDNVGLNELVVDHDIVMRTDRSIAAGVPLPFSLPTTPPATPPTCSIGDTAALLPIDCVVEAEHLVSDAHYYSEHALFMKSPPSPAQSTVTLRNNLGHTSINIADFLKLGHAKNCWCGYCNSDPYSDFIGKIGTSPSSSTTLAGQDSADDEGDGKDDDDCDDDSALSLTLHHSSSDLDADADVPDLLDLIDACTTRNSHKHSKNDTVEDDDWLLFTPLPLALATAEDRFDSASPLYLPSSPILHRQHQQRAPTPAIVITSADPSADDCSDDYVAIATPSAASTGDSTVWPTWESMFPRRPSSAWEAGLAQFGDERVGCGFAAAAEGSWRWGRESEGEW